MAMKEKNPKEKIKAIIKAKLEEGKSLKDLACETDLSYIRIHNFYSGRREVLDVDFAQELLRGLGEEMTLK
ncbi:MAG: hypothetical protein AAFO03_08125 [Bacteroidota bacterium]